MSLQENIEKKIFVPPLNCSGGGQFSGGAVPPLKLLGGGDCPTFPPCIRSCIYIYIYIQGRIQDLAQGGDKSGAKRLKNFLSPP